MIASGTIVAVPEPSPRIHPVYIGKTDRRYRLWNRGATPVTVTIRFPGISQEKSAHLPAGVSIDVESSRITVVRSDPFSTVLCTIDYQHLEPTETAPIGRVNPSPTSVGFLYSGQPLGSARRYRIWNRGTQSVQVTIRQQAANPTDHELAAEASVDVESVMEVSVSGPDSGFVEYQNVEP